MHSFVAQMRQALAAGRLVSHEDRVLLGVSGGADSMALLHAFAALREAFRLHLTAAHLDHALRPSSAQDARFVQAAAENLGVGCVVERRSVSEFCERHGYSLEEGARKLRYEFLEATAQRHSASVVAVAHTADDQAETVLARLLRGSGLAGLSAIPLKRQLGEVLLIRPLLGFWRSEVATYLKESGVAHREDASNRDLRFTRNRIRHELIPRLEQSFNPNIKHLLVQFAAQAQADDAYLQAAALRQWKRTAKTTGERQVTLRLETLRRQPLALKRQLIRKAIRQVKGDLRAFEFRHWTEIEALLESRPAGSVVHLPEDVVVRKESQLLIVSQQPPTRQSKSSHRASSCPTENAGVY